MESWFNKVYRVTHVAINGSTAGYRHDMKRGIWIVTLDGSPAGLAPDKDGAKEVAEKLLHDLDEMHISRAYASLKWAEEKWPSAGQQVWIAEIETHRPDTCRQAVVELLKNAAH